MNQTHRAAAARFRGAPYTAVSGQPVPFSAITRESPGEMRAKRAVDGGHFVIFKEDRVLLIGCKAFHDQV